MNIFKIFKNRLYDGVMYPAIGYWYDYTSKDIEIEHSTYIFNSFFNTVFLWKVKLKDYRFPYKRSALEKIYNYGFRLKVVNFSMDSTEIVKEIDFNPTIADEWLEYIDFIKEHFMEKNTKYNTQINFQTISENYISLFQ
jgi:hypothetical protein